ncbi:lysophospholipase L1-like esterase [Pseudonocardia sediminis]|uniref:Lysophospholipase L1-like esterase n=1 Tax=Pseudonocardia sediminis TaxID=1397368 RepID=A0A4Q7V343_PSEST|nr:SGNH/GDSL hydrolase family protein [Pseudonocardia sediminis]RZT87914.1 lysophospholipase L1-like esterase [Pseudonocardia sediminis]
MQWSLRVRPAVVALAVLSVVAVVLLVLAIQRASAPPPVSGSPPAVDGARPAVAFIGDSFTSGTVEGGLGASNYTQLLADRSGWTVTNAAADGAGYVDPAPGGTFREDQLPRVVAARPALVVVQGSRSDADRPSSEVRDAATRLYTELRQALPQARMVVIGPIRASDDVPESVEGTRDAIREAAATAQLPFLDPIEDRWFDGTDETMVGPDPVFSPERQEQLTDEGHRRMADLVGEGLRRIGAAPR